jgi:ubiquinone/menaquinone biosynthesis C-methylase UbiE
MKKSALEALRCPKSKKKVELDEGYEEKDGEVINGKLSSEAGHKYIISDGIPDFITSDDLIDDAAFARNYYKGIAATYDLNVDITFKLYNEDELQVRNSMIDLLNLKPGYSVLEVSAGTGKDSELIASRLDNSGHLYCLDISPDMLRFAKERTRKYNVATEIVCGTACDLPFHDNTFDALYCFAGVGHFPDLHKGLKEMARVVKPGGKVVFCEKNVPEWLRNTDYGKICINNNPMFADPVPLKYIPVEARNVCLRWVNGNVHYVFDYVVGEGEPIGNFDIEIPGERGGTFNTRYYGKLESVKVETKKKAIAAQKLTGKSMHEWLDELISKESDRILNKRKNEE